MPDVGKSPPKPEDVELGQPQQENVLSQSAPRYGFPAAANFIACDPNRSFSIYRAFHSLSASNLLFLEAELLELQKEQLDMDIEDSRRGPSTAIYLRSWKNLTLSVDGRQKQRVALMMRIGSVLKEYSLALQETVLKMSKPDKSALEAAKAWFHGGTEGPNGRQATTFLGLGATRLDDEMDLVGLHPSFQKDWLVKLVSLPYLRMLCLDSHIDENLALLSIEKINRAVASLSLLIAAILFIGAIVCLHLVTDNNIKLGLICAFTITFALTVHLLTNARRAELFASTAAYAAVMVVFVSGNLGSSSPAAPA